MNVTYNNESQLVTTLTRLEMELCTADRFGNMTDVTTYLGIPGVYSCFAKDEQMPVWGSQSGRNAMPMI
jgi:hypothetical protein